MAAPVRLGRKRPLPACPNPLFVRWLTEWRDAAASRGRRTRFVFQKVGPLGSDGVKCWLKQTIRPFSALPCSNRAPYPCQALCSLRRYPLPLHSGKEAKILQHFGDGLCRMLDERLQQHRASDGERLTGGSDPLPPPGTASVLTLDTSPVNSPLRC